MTQLPLYDKVQKEYEHQYTFENRKQKRLTQRKTSRENSPQYPQ